MTNDALKKTQIQILLINLYKIITTITQCTLLVNKNKRVKPNPTVKIFNKQLC